MHRKRVQKKKSGQEKFGLWPEKRKTANRTMRIHL